MKGISHLGLLVCLLLLAALPVRADGVACASQPRTADGTTIDTPVPNAVVTSPFTIRGTYRSPFEAFVPIKLLDANGDELLDASTRTSSSEGLQPYASTVAFSVNAPTAACIVVYAERGPNLELTPLVQVPVTLSPAAGLPNTGAGDLPLASIAVPLVLLAAGLITRRSAVLGRP
jgi:hypothetical protein